MGDEAEKLRMSGNLRGYNLRILKLLDLNEIILRVVKEFKIIIREPLASIFRKLLDTGVLPRLWRLMCSIHIEEVGRQIPNE